MRKLALLAVLSGCAPAIWTPPREVQAIKDARCARQIPDHKLVICTESRGECYCDRPIWSTISTAQALAPDVK